MSRTTTRPTVFVLLAACSAPTIGDDAATSSDNPVIDYTEPTLSLGDLGTSTYKGFAGGLYPGGNDVPDAHLAAGRAAAAQVEKLDVNGIPSASGRYVVLSLGMSNATQEWCSAGGDLSPCDPWSLMGQATADPAVDRDGLALVNGARGGQTCGLWANPMDPNWARVDGDLQALGLAEPQVQVVWLKCANPGPTVALPATGAEAYTMLGHLGAIVRNAKQRYPNLRMVLLSDRIYAGYASSALNPEPFAYEAGFSVKWLIQAQIEGDTTTLADDVTYATAPWLAWAADLWANGATPRSDGLTWLPQDYAADGTHPATSGREKVADHLLAFFRTSPVTRCWFLAGEACE